MFEGVVSGGGNVTPATLWYTGGSWRNAW